MHEIKLDGYRMHARIDGGMAQLLTRSGLDWTEKYPQIAGALKDLPCRSAYLDGELCGVRPDGITSFALIQAATDQRNASDLVFFLFDLLHLDGTDQSILPLSDRKKRLQTLLADAPSNLHYSQHFNKDGPDFLKAACRVGVEGVISKRLSEPYKPNDRGTWVKSKCLNEDEFIVVGWTDPEGRRPKLGALLLGYYDADGKLLYAGRAGTGMTDKQLGAIWARLQPLAADKMPLAFPPPKESRFGSRLEVSRVHWVRPETVVMVTYLTWETGGLLRHVVFEGIREDKNPTEVKMPTTGPG